ncbi:MAG: SDR family NAD(P)-dependent oxidoreductase [Myxococcota bacterium]
MSDVKRALITGAQGALGSVVTKRFLDAGVEVVGVDQTYDAEGVHNHPELGASFYHLKMDVTDAQAVGDGVAQIEQERGPIDALVHIAGGFRAAPIHELPDRDLDFLLQLNLRSSFLLARAVMGRFRTRGFGRMVFVSSMTTLAPNAGSSAYAASKAGVNALVRGVADEVKELDVTVNAVLPSIIDTPANREAMSSMDFSTWVPREHLAELIFSFTEPHMASVNGALIPVAAKT